jgi:imidazolonepropionase-like amidohydrolase
MAHANGAAAVSIAIQAGCDSVEHGFFATGEVLRRAPERGTRWVPTLATMWAMAESPALEPSQREVARRTL